MYKNLIKIRNNLLANAEFKLYAMQDIVSVDGKMLIRKDECIVTATSSKDGKVPIISDLPLSMYKLKETKAPIGYVSTNFEEQIDAHYQGQDIPSITYKAFIENEITEVEVAKKDITNDEGNRRCTNDDLPKKMNLGQFLQHGFLDKMVRMIKARSSHIS